MSKSERSENVAVTAAALSEFAYQPTVRAEGIDPEKPFGSASYKHMKGLLMQRVKPSRYVHSLSVAKTARKLARMYDCDDKMARMAGLLHDWDKALLPEQLGKRIAHYDIQVSAETLKEMPWILHGPTAAAVLADEFPEFGEEVYQAIARHTVGAPAMSKLDMIVFVADKIEPTHEVDEYRCLYDQIGALTLEDLFFEVLKVGMKYLFEAEKPLNSESAVVWNWYVNNRSKVEGE